MPTTCLKTLDSNILNDCTEDFGMGFEQTAYIINKADIDASTSVITGNILDTIALKATKKAYTAYSPSARMAFTGSISEASVTNFGTIVDKTVSILLMANSPRNAMSVDELRQGSYVIVLENKAKGLQATLNPGEQAFEVFGWDQGLTFDSATKDPYSEDSNGGWLVNLKEERAKTSSLFLFKTSYTATKAALEALLTPTVIP